MASASIDWIYKIDLDRQDYEVVVSYNEYKAGVVGTGHIIVDDHVLEVSFSHGGPVDVPVSGFYDMYGHYHPPGIVHLNAIDVHILDISTNKRKWVFISKLFRNPVRTMRATSGDILDICGTKVMIKSNFIYCNDRYCRNPNYVKLTLSKVRS